MAKWKREERARFEDMPQELQDVGLDSSPELKRERAGWLEANGLTMVDYMSWRRAKDPAAKLRPPSRRRHMSAEELAEFDRQREQEGDPRW
jgi:hypothetical protein